MTKKWVWLFLPIWMMTLFIHAAAKTELNQLISDLKIAKKEKQVKATLPFIYNANLTGGYLTMPSARAQPSGTIAFGASWLPPYQVYAASMQLFPFVEIVGNYRVYNNHFEQNFGHRGFGNDADRMANVKFAIPIGSLSSWQLPSIAFGLEDFYGSKRFHSIYGVATQEFSEIGLEASLGYSQGRMRHLFGGLAWSPFMSVSLPLKSQVTFFSEWDNIDYQHHEGEHPKGRHQKSKINAGVQLSLLDTIALKASYLRGKEWAFSANASYNFGESKGIVPKIHDPKPYVGPANTESLNDLRPLELYKKELVGALQEQGFYVTKIALTTQDDDTYRMWIKLINMRYLKEEEAKRRIDYVLAYLLPKNMQFVDITLEEGGVNAVSYFYHRKSLQDFYDKKIDQHTLDLLTPPLQPLSCPSSDNTSILFQQNKTQVSWLLRPRLLSFFGSVSGKYKYSAGLIGGPQGYLFDSIYYKVLMSYSFASSASEVGTIDVYNPSRLINVRSDSVLYYQKKHISLEKAYLQSGWYLGKNWYSRLAMGYFEAAYVGAASELLWYPVSSPIALGFRGATVWKREPYKLTIMHKVRQLKETKAIDVSFTGLQYFLDVYYQFKPLAIDAKMSIGQFLAKDKGVKFQVERYFDSGMRFGVWHTITNAHDIVNGKTYYDTGVSLKIPFSLFTTKSNRNMLGYGLAFWLRDSGAEAQTGKPLYPTLQRARH